MTVFIRSLSCIATIVLSVSALGATISPEIAIPPRYVPLLAQTSRVSVASNGRDFFAVWRDGRYPAMTWGTRISAGGEPLDPLGIPLSEEWWDRPTVVWCGTSWILIGTIYTTTGSGAMTQHVAAARLDAEGRLIAGPVALVEGRFDENQRHAVAVNGTRMIIGYTRSEHPAAIIVDETFRFVREAGARGGNFFLPHGDGFAAFSDASGSPSLFATELDADGAIVHTGSYSTPISLSTVATDGTDYLLIGSPEAVVLPGGLAGEPRTSTLAEQLSAYSVSALWAGDHYLLLRERWTGSWTTLSLLRVERDGRIAGEVDTERHDSSGNLALAGDRLLLIAEHDSPRAQVYSAATSRPLHEAFPLTMNAVAQSLPAVASAPSMDLLLWREGQRATGSRLSGDGTSLDSTGVPLLPQNEPRALDNENSVSSQDSPPVAFDGTQFVVPYVQADGRVRARFVSPAEGALPDSLELAGPFGDSAKADKPAAAAGRNQTLIAWTTFLQRQILGATIDAATRRPIAPPAPLLPSPTADQFADRPALAWNGSHYLLVWREWKPKPYLPPGYPRFDPEAVRAVRLTEQLMPVDLTPLTISITVTASDLPAVASDGHDWLVVWGGSVRRVLADGSMSDPIVAGSNQLDVAWSGVQYALAWTDGTTAKLAYVPPSGPLAMTPPLILTTSAGYGSRVHITNAGYDRVAVAYSRIATERIYGSVSRVFLRHVSTLAPPAKRRAVRP